MDLERARALAESGLVEPVVTIVRAAPVPVNKMAHAPATKAPSVIPARRGRPLKVR